MDNMVYGIGEIHRRLPYRCSSLLLDRVLVESDDRCVGLKALSCNEPVFQGHFPGHPIMPGVLQVEAMEQVAQIAVRDRLDPAGQQEVFLKSLRKVKFRKPANPGDRLQVEVDVLGVEGGEAQVRAVNRIHAGISCQAELTLGVRPRLMPDRMEREYTDIDKNSDIAMDTNGIVRIIPHRFPFLLVDYIVSFADPKVLAVKNVTAGDPIMHHYSPDYVVLPGTVQAEIIAQAGAVLMLSRPENQGKIAYFMSIDESQCFHPVFPGDQLRIDVELPESKSRFGRGHGSLSVAGREVSRTVMTFAVVDP
jgi:3-hydroxymyristoyl/3-hydroxydecanoyl-(acyl carrier protein) dehydratase